MHITENITEEEIMNLLETDIDGFFNEIKKIGFNSEAFAKKLDLPRVIVKERYKMSQSMIYAAEATFWLTYFVERELRNMIIETEEKVLGKHSELIDNALDRMTMGDLIALIEKSYPTPSTLEFTKLAWKIKTLRDNVAHGRLDELTYRGDSLHDSKGQMKLFIDLMKASRKKDPT